MLNSFFKCGQMAKRKTELPWSNQPAYLLIYSIWISLQSVQAQTACTLLLSFHLLFPTLSTCPPSHALQCTRWFPESSDGMSSLPAASTSGCPVLNLPAWPTDKPQWWIQGVIIQSLAYLLKHSGCFMWWLYTCVSWFCLCVCSLAGSMVHTLGWWVCEVSGCFGGAVAGKGNY